MSQRVIQLIIFMFYSSACSLLTCNYSSSTRKRFKIQTNGLVINVPCSLLQELQQLSELQDHNLHIPMLFAHVNHNVLATSQPVENGSASPRTSKLTRLGLYEQLG